MLEASDDYCIVLKTDDAVRKNSLNAMLFVNIDRPIAERLLDETLEVRKYRSGKPGMDDCAVVMDSKRYLWNIPRKILQGIDK